MASEGYLFIGLIVLALSLYCLPIVRQKLNRETFEKLINDAKGKSELKKDIAIALEDGVLTDNEYETLKAKASELQVSEDVIDKARYKDFEKRTKSIITEVQKTRRYSPAQEDEIKRIANNLQVIPQIDHNFEICRKLWSYENNGTLEKEIHDVPIILKKGEECYFSTSATWLQVKKVTQHKGYAGASLGFRVAKGVRFSVGRGIPVKNTYEEMQPLSDGEIYITNKRIIFDGVKKSTNVTYGRLIQLELYQNGVEIRKTTGKPDFFEIPEIYAEYISAIAHDVLN